MKSEIISDMAQDYVSRLYERDEYPVDLNDIRIDVEEAFKAGADWRINSVWHDASEKPATNRKALVKYISGDGKIKYRVDVFCGYEWKEMCHYDKLIQFAYIEDLTNTEE